MGKRYSLEDAGGEMYLLENGIPTGITLAPFDVDNELLVKLLNKQTDEIVKLREALVGMTNCYVELANSGDCGFWNPEEEAVVIKAREALKEKQP